MRKLTFVIVIIVLTLFISIVNANPPLQTTDDGSCSAVAQSALDAVQTVCEATGRNQVCYGNISIDADASDDALNFKFEQAGDIADLSDVAGLRLKTLDYFSDEWGVALLRVQASLPDDAPQNVTMLLFGNVEIANQGGDDLVNLKMTTTTPSNIRLSPSSNGPILGSVGGSEELVANGRITNAVGEEWIRLQFHRGPGGVGWIWGNLLTTDGDKNTLIELETEAARPFGPMQAFTFNSGQGDRPCETAPDSGILIQTPAGVGEINFLINEVDIQIGSTVFLQSAPSTNMSVRTLDGRVLTTTDGVTRLVPKGAQVSIPVDDEGFASGPPDLPEPYDLDELDELDYALDEDFFEEDFELDEALDDEFLDEFNDFFNDGEFDAFFDLLLEDEFDDEFDTFFDNLLEGEFGDEDLDSFINDYFDSEFEGELGLLVEDALESDFIEADAFGEGDDFGGDCFEDECFGEGDDFGGDCFEDECFGEDEFGDDEFFEDDYYDDESFDDDGFE